MLLGWCCGIAMLLPGNQNNPEVRLSAHHPRVCLRCPLERSRFDHGSDAAQATEAQSRVTCTRISRERAFELLASKDEVRVRDCDRIRTDTYEDGNTVRAQRLERFRHRLGAGCRDQNYLRATQCLQGCHLIDSRVVDVVMG